MSTDEDIEASLNSKYKKQWIVVGIIVVTISVAINPLFFGANNNNQDEHTKLYVDDDEEFLQLVNDTYRDEDLVEWTPAIPPQGNPDEPGHLSEPVVVPPEKEELAKERFEENEFNVVVSEMISCNRTLADSRSPECIAVDYPKKLPTTSVIIVFHNEAWSTLQRTLWSVYNTSPKELLKEIILVDDSSNRQYLWTKLPEFIQNFPVRIVSARTIKRTGLIQAKLLGAKFAKGQVLTFLDSHCECNVGWLEPLLARVSENRKVAIAPVIDTIDDNNFGLIKLIDKIGAFTSDFAFQWIPVPDREINRLQGDQTVPVRSPAMAGGLFSIDKEYFYKIGSYDEDMKIWGSENIELSLRLWTCGGMIEQHPCSRVGHVFRKKTPYVLPGGANQVIYHNAARLVDVWTDDYKTQYYQRHPGAPEKRTDVKKRIDLRRNLKCKSFNWYLRNIFPESSLNVQYKLHGSIENLSKVGSCLDTMGHKNENETVGVSPCHNLGGHQFFSLSENNELRKDALCLDADNLSSPIKLFICHGQGGNQRWLYDEKTKSIRQNEMRCLSLQKESEPTLEECNGSADQQWEFRKPTITVV